MDRCKGKKHYDTEFEAERAASKTSWFIGDEMLHYACGRHWHIANRDKAKRGQHPKYRSCQPCDIAIVRFSRWQKHCATARHRARVVKAKETA